MYFSQLPNKSIRSQFISYDGRQSTVQSITYGVPQGSTLGHVLFIIYMNDMQCVHVTLYCSLRRWYTSVVIHEKICLAVITGSKRHSLQAVELSQRTQAVDLPFWGHAEPLDGWRCCSQKRVMSRPNRVRQL